MLNFKKKKPQPKPPGKDQPDIFLGAAVPKDVIAPSAIKEVRPGDDSLRGKATDYWVEVGTTAEPVRYFRSFFAAVTGGSTHAGILNPLYAGDVGDSDCDVAVHLIPADPARTSWQMEQKIAQLEADYAEEANPARKQTILMQIKDLQRKHAALRTGAEKLFFASIQAAVSSTNLDSFLRSCSSLVKKYAGKGFHMRAADTRQLSALLGMTPLDRETLKDTFRDMESSNIADLFPFGLGGIRHKTGIVIGNDPQGNIIFYDCWHPALGNYNIIIFGRAGFGKSFLVKLITGRSCVIGVQTAIIDPEAEYENLMVGLGCPYIRLAPNSKDRINIFDVDAEEDENGALRVDLDGAIKAVQAVVFKMIRTIDANVLTGQAKVLIQEKIKELYARRGITDDPSSLYESKVSSGVIDLVGIKKEMPTLSDLHALMERDPDLKSIAQLLGAFTVKGGTPSQAIFDCRSNVGDLRRLPAFAFSVAGLDEDIMRPIGLFVATKWVWEKFGQDRSRKKRIVVDEAQTMMDSPETAKWLEDAFRRSRKRNISMCAATQGFEVFLRVPQGMGILKNATTKFLMKQEPVDIEAVQQKFNLSEGEAHFLLNARKGEGIIRVDNDASVFFGKTTDREYLMYSSDPNELITREMVVDEAP